MKLLGRYQGRNGQIEIVECSWDGTRVYFEEGVRQSQATPDGESVFTYVKLMDELLSRLRTDPGAGLRRRQSRDPAVALGKKLTIVDNNPISFVMRKSISNCRTNYPASSPTSANSYSMIARITTASRLTSADQDFGSTMSSMPRPATQSLPLGARRPNSDERDGVQRH